ncbi:MAG: hypothetical protein MJ092_04455 [Lachnospiraceae bacterium]|nr:hypothetical protein [Lachnospiraceae bacterium]
METNYKYLRIQGRNPVINTLTGKGIFSLCMELVRDHVMEQEDEELYLEIDKWFSNNLPWPEPCMNQERVVCYFKTENDNEMLKWIKPTLWLLGKYNIPYYLVYTNTPGEIVYEDKYQIVARVDDIVIQPVPESWSKEQKDNQ